MTTSFTKAALAPVAAALALFAASSIPASAQSTLTNGPNGAQPNTLGKSRPHSEMMTRRPLTVRRAGAPVEAAVAAPAAVVANPVSGAFGAANTVVGLPFQVIGGIFPSNAPLKGGVTSVRYVGTGAKQGEIDEGWQMPIPVDRAGPIYVVENGDPSISPLSLVGQPIRAVGTFATTPLRVLGGVGGPAPF